MRLTRRFLRMFAASALLAVSLAGCGGDGGTEPGDSDVAGRWTGTLEEEGGGTGSLTLTLSENDGAVTGNGSFTFGLESLPLTVTGNYDVPNLTLSLDSPGFEAATLSASINGSRMTGQLSGSGFENVDVVLDRE